jgi:hypothetical protein
LKELGLQNTNKKALVETRADYNAHEKKIIVNRPYLHDSVHHLHLMIFYVTAARLFYQNDK